jgi:glycosyltransferase involved in cell wall biosynthesis
MAWRPSNIVAIPVKNEEARIGLCLSALGRQAGDFDHLLLLLNNCTDDTLRICEWFSQCSTKIRIVQHELSGVLASAGEARRLALEYAVEMAGDGVILTTDADAVPDHDWVATNLRAIERGADVVCGKARIDPLDAAGIPDSLQIDEESEALLMSIQDEIAAMLDPAPVDPWPRHQQHSGASLAMRATVLRKAGGPPSVATGEDRALIEKLALVDAAIRHDPEISVRVSGRLDGRAAGGMAATLRRRLRQRDRWTDERLEPTVDSYRRVLARIRLRAVMQGCDSVACLAEDLLIGTGAARQALAVPHFGAAWANLQVLSPVLQRRRVEFCGLRREIRQAAELRDQLNAELGTPRLSRQRRDNEGDLSHDENAQ